ncbi:DUF421 domain-containing protein [Sediminibacterium ginsengisoli]|uniref:YetF C-terminal domain-containing protein n=1 Tax=Sediminibacterium ginsengisoli TaxID=413434 RepID=A0A1T4R125_9BACT|nr:YetF domain-containing protein [Sediminibacterium ginsengisoli]SKA09694.1 Protein of unknown function [Sediminibacterium ginsengisoli]
METILFLFGEGKDLNTLQMGCRAAVSFFVALLLIRMAGQRTFGKGSAFDNVVIIMLGAILSRAVVGVSPVLPVVTACLIITLIHRLLAWLSMYSEWIGAIVKGKAYCLYKNGRRQKGNMKKQLISPKDMLESVRLQTGKDSLDEVDAIHLERNGQISVITKKTQ